MDSTNFAIVVAGLLSAAGLYFYLSKKLEQYHRDDEFEQMKMEVRKSYEILHQSQQIWLDHKVELEKEISKLMKECQAFRNGYVTEFKARAAAVKEYTDKAKEHLEGIPKPKRKKKERNG